MLVIIIIIDMPEFHLAALLIHSASTDSQRYIEGDSMIEIGIPRLDELLGADTKKGSNILLVGPPMSGKEVILNHIMYHGVAKNEDAIITVNTREPGAHILEWFKENKLLSSRIGIVDCVTKMIGNTADEDENIKVANSPIDLTGIGIRISQFFEKFLGTENIRKIQLSINSLSTLLMYSNIKTIYRFLHVFTGRIRAIGGIGIYVLESGIHDMQAISALNQLFDCMIEVKSEDDKNFIRVVGLSQKPTHWLEYETDGANIIIGE